ncbi:unnamed protein product [Cladocopium goreaui]|uniref:Uncharacterized protein n=1 Tax=Cladocopium goreaui TaxID=2562237 RepID=A0A9P1M265_9DINO|nr:unnamed protein product [Cladocopium goreaui]
MATVGGRSLLTGQSRPSRQLSCERAQQDVRPVPRYQTICFEENRTMKSRIEKKLWLFKIPIVEWI